MDKKALVAGALSKVNKTFLFITSVIAALITVGAFSIISYTKITRSVEAEVFLLETQLNVETEMKERALAQLGNVINVRDTYRSNLKEIVELLYHKDTYLGIGGATIPVETSDEAVLLQMQTVISGMNDDLQLMANVKEYLEAREEFINAFPFIWPVKGGIPDTSSNYGFRYDPLNEEDGIQYHAGIDIPGDIGQPIQATASGKIIGLYINKYIHGEYGNLIIIQHDYGFQTYYAHLDNVKVSWGDEVKKGDIIGELGNTGRSTGPHIHYEVRHNKVPLDPMNYLSINF